MKGNCPSPPILIFRPFCRHSDPRHPESLKMTTANRELNTIAAQEYRYGFVTDIEADVAPKGLNEDIVRWISAKKNEPEFMLQWRLKAFRHWEKLRAQEQTPTWAKVHYPPIDYQNIIYYSAPKSKVKLESLDEVDPELLRTYEKLGIPLEEQKRLAGVAVDAIFDSVSIATTFRKELSKHGIVFCSFSEALQEHPDLIQKYLGSVVPYSDNFYAALNAAVFSDGSFCYIPKGVPLPLGADHLLPHQHRRNGPVRTHPDNRRRRQLRQLPGGVQRPHAGRKPASRRRRGTHSPQGRRD